MSESVAKESPGKKMGVSALGCGCICSLIFSFVLLTGGAVGIFELGFYLLFGWAAFIRETCPRITWDAGGIIFGLLCLAGIAVIAQNFLSWVYRNLMKEKGNPNAEWNWRWTFTGLACISLLFLIAMSVTGIAHQAAWLRETSGPMFEQRPKGMEAYRDMKTAELVVRQALLDTNTIAGLRADIKRPPSAPQHTEYERKGIESCKLLVLSSDGVHVDGVLVLPSKTNAFTHDVPFVTEKSSEHMPRKDVSEFLKTNESHIIQL